MAPFIDRTEAENKSDNFPFNVKIDLNKCNGCAECVDVCPVDVFELIDGKAQAINMARCLGCESCVEVCTRSAVTVTENNTFAKSDQFKEQIKEKTKSETEPLSNTIDLNYRNTSLPKPSGVTYTQNMTLPMVFACSVGLVMILGVLYNFVKNIKPSSKLLPTTIVILGFILVSCPFWSSITVKGPGVEVSMLCKAYQQEEEINKAFLDRTEPISDGRRRALRKLYDNSRINTNDSSYVSSDSFNPNKLAERDRRINMLLKLVTDTPLQSKPHNTQKK
jgi:NAD-dependent dihydropyrimidine dehydrogenase PreA subunit